MNLCEEIPYDFSDNISIGPFFEPSDFSEFSDEEEVWEI